MAAQSDTASAAGGDRVLRAAIQWDILLKEQPDDAGLRAEFETWLADRAEHRAAWSHTGHVLGLIGQAQSVAFLPAAKARPMEFSRPRGKRSGVLAAAIAASLMIALLAPQAMRRAQADHMTGGAEQDVVTLQDGSTVRLAPSSALDVDYADGRREVRLLAGEAYFDVTPDPARPFAVQAGSARVTVLGTGFNVRLGAAGTDVAVNHGRVQVAYPGAIAALTDGDWLRIAADGAARTGEIAPDLVGGWAADRIVAVDQTLAEVLADVRRYYSGAIVLADRSMGERIVTGVYDMTDPARSVGVIVQPLGAKVTRITPWLLVVSPA